MRKKLLSIVIVSAALSMFGGCAYNETGKTGTQEESGVLTITESTLKKTESTSKETKTPKQTAGEALKSLLEDNLNCLQNIFMNNTLPTQGASIKDNIYQVSEKSFKNYSEFENYIRSVYCKETADLYLNKYPYENNTLYVNIDGKLYVNLNLSGGRGYYVDWTNYSYTIDSENDTECSFTVNCKITMPGDNPVPEDYKIKGNAVLENGNWVLKKMLY